MAQPDPIEQRRRYVEAWNKTMIDIWQERISKFDIIDTGELYRSPLSLPVRADGRFYDMSLSHTFLEYGLWQDLGVGREVSIGNPGDIGRPKERKRRRWFSTKYYSSALNLRDFMAESLGREFVGMFASLDAEKLRHKSEYYLRKGLG